MRKVGPPRLSRSFRSELDGSRFVNRYWFTPLARNPPSTTSRCPVTKLAASDARNTAAPPSSSSFPNRRIGVRSRNSRPRSVPSSRAAFRSVRKTPGARALTHTPDCGPLDGQRFRKRSHRRLAGTVCGNLIERDKRRKRSNINDAAVTALDHMAPKHAAGAQSPVQIGFEDRVPIGIRDLERGRSFGAAGAVHQNLNAAEFGVDRLQKLHQAGLVGDVASLIQRSPAECLNFRRQRQHLWARRPVGTTLAPACASARVSASPMPLVPPITTAVWLVRSRRG